MTRSNILISSIVALAFLAIGGAWLYGQQQISPSAKEASFPQLSPANPPANASPVQQSRQVVAPDSTSSPVLARSPVRPVPRATTLLPLAASPLVGTPSSTPSSVVLNTPTTLTVTVQITDPSLIAGSVNLLRLAPTGTQSTILGVMHDDGKNGDAVPADHIYTLQIPFTEPIPTTIQLQISAAFKGLLKRVTSNILAVNVNTLYTNSTVGVTIQYPPGQFLGPPTPGTSSALRIQSTPEYLALGEPIGDSSTNTAISEDGYAITISSSTYTQPFTINQWLVDTMPDYAIDTITPTTVQGLSAYIVTFRDNLQAGTPFVVVPHGSIVFTIAYNSTFDDGTPAEAAGLAAFYQLLTTLQFLK